MINMKSTIEVILAAKALLDAFNSNRHFAIKIENEPFMPLSIERHDEIVTVSHYFEQNGDLVPDPDMQFLILPANGMWIPLAIQYASGRYVRCGKLVENRWHLSEQELDVERRLINVIEERVRERAVVVVAVGRGVTVAGGEGDKLTF